mgnify:CR=1 FL=1
MTLVNVTDTYQVERPPGEPLFSGPTILWSLVQGTLVLAVTGAVFVLAPGYGLTSDQARALTASANTETMVSMCDFSTM